MANECKIKIQIFLKDFEKDSSPTYVTRKCNLKYINWDILTESGLTLHMIKVDSVTVPYGSQSRHYLIDRSTVDGEMGRETHRERNLRCTKK